MLAKIALVLHLSLIMIGKTLVHVSVWLATPVEGDTTLATVDRGDIPTSSTGSDTIGDRMLVI